MTFYTISQLSELSGVKTHTIRIWEKRYGLLEPMRTDSNIRRYDDVQLRRLLNTVTLLYNGVKISEIASYSEKEINALINKKVEESFSLDITAEAIINQILDAGLTFNEAGFEKAFSSAILRFGVSGTYLKVIYPLLVRTGYMWQSTKLNPGQEHFISNLIQRKLFTAIDSIPIAPNPKRKWILFLMENEYHEIGLLFAYYLLRCAGHDVVYLGPNTPYEDLKGASKTYKPTDVLFFIVHRIPKARIQQFFKKLETDFKKSNIIAVGDEEIFEQVKTSKNIQTVSTVSQFEKHFL